MSKIFDFCGGRKSTAFWASFICFNVLFILKYEMTAYTIGITSLNSIFGITNLAEHKIKQGQK